MQCKGALRRPLRDIIKSIGHIDKHTTSSPSPPSPPASALRLSLSSASCANSCHHQLRYSAALPYVSASIGVVRPLSSARGHGHGHGLPSDSFHTTSQRQNARGMTARAYTSTARYLPFEAPANDAAAPAASEGDADCLTRSAIHAASDAAVTVDGGAVKNGAVDEVAVDDGADDKSIQELGIKLPSDFGPNYFHRQLRRHKAELAKAAWRYTVQHKQRDGDLWKRMLADLYKATPTKHSRYKRIVEFAKLPKGVAAVFEPNTELAILEIMQRTGCHIQMAPEYAVEGSPKAFTGVALQGTYAQNDSALSLLPSYIKASSLESTETRARLTRHDIHRMLHADGEGGTTDPEHWATYDDESTADLSSSKDFEADKRLQSGAIVRSVWSRDRTKGNVQQPGSSCKLDLPSLRNATEFTAYVDDLTSMRMGVLSREDRAQQTGNRTKRRVDTVVDTLVSLFKDPATSHLCTTESIGRSFEFLAKHQNFFALRQIMQSLDEGNREIGITGFNAMLSVVADAGDVHHFERVLALMRRRDIAPGSLTWASIHNLICRRMPAEADAIPILMRDKGLLRDNSALVAVIRNEVRQHLLAHIQRGGDTAGFLQTYSTRVHVIYDRPDFKWLGIDVLNRMVRVLISLGRTDEAVMLLRRFRREGLGPLETGTLNTFLSSTSDDFDAGSAIATLKMFHVGKDGAVMPDRITYMILFMIAWRRKYYNMLRVVWRYACVAGQVPYDMRERMIRSLYKYSPMNAGVVNPSLVFKAWAAKFAIGVSRDLTPHNPGTLGDDERRLLELGCQHGLEKGSAESKARIHEMKRLVQDDLEEAGRCKPVHPLIDLLEQAWKKDLSWHERGIGRAASQIVPSSAESGILETVMLDGTRVPMKSGDFTRFRKWEVPSRLRQT